MGSNQQQSFISKRNGTKQEISLEKIIKRIENACLPVNQYVPKLDKNAINPQELASHIMDRLPATISFQEMDDFLADYAKTKIVDHPDFGKLAGRFICSNIHKNTKEWNSFSATTQKLRHAIHPGTGKPASVVNDTYYENVMANAEILDAVIDYKMDYLFTCFGLRTLEYSYLIKIGSPTDRKKRILVERPQDMIMRVAVGIHGSDIKSVIETYDLMTRHYFTHASPTLFNCGTVTPQLSSCFLLGLQDDSIEGIYDTLKEAAIISKTAGGLGIHFHDLRAKGSPISSWSGTHPGLMAFLQIFNVSVKKVSQGGDKRRGAAAIYISDWHLDVKDFIDCRKNAGNEDLRTRDLFPAIWVSDLFMERVKAGKNWSLMCPHECPGLSDVHGEEFKALYEKYEAEGKGKEVVKARALFDQINSARIETGTPYVCFKDTINRKSNQENVGIIKSSNLCTEIVQYSDSEETAVCNLASIAVNKFVKYSPIPSLRPYVDYREMKRVVKIMTRNLDKVIDVNFYAVDKTRISNMKTRPMGLGVQGLADLFFKLRIPFESEEAALINKRIFETIYYGALEASCEIAKEKGETYELFEGSPLSKGIFQFDMGKENIKNRDIYFNSLPIHDWEQLRRDIMKYGVHNSMFVAPMPTASTAQILGNSESFEPLTSNMYNRNVLSGSFQVVNEYVIRELIKLGEWNSVTKQRIMASGGSIQTLPNIPKSTKELFKTVWEINPRTTLDMAIQRGMFVDQAQSLNLFVEEPELSKVRSMTMYAWEKGIKTLYYLRTKGAARAVQFTVDKNVLQEVKKEAPSPVAAFSAPVREEEEEKKSSIVVPDPAAALLCSINNPGACEMCSS
uniref:Ribonucleoside-diphosphate reductase n=1 Tax=White spot syndrome virus TaxID=342409 RepID=A0A2I6DZG4_9VIRU|nr:putative ribonucleotide reductase large subunit (RR1) [White spot syndrome virus]